MKKFYLVHRSFFTLHSFSEEGSVGGLIFAAFFLCAANFLLLSSPAKAQGAWMQKANFGGTLLYLKN